MMSGAGREPGTAHAGEHGASPRAVASRHRWRGRKSAAPGPTERSAAGAAPLDTSCPVRV